MSRKVLSGATFGRRCRLRTVLLACMALLSVSACGKKAAPKPPEEVAPGIATFVTLTPQADAVLISWQAPETDVNGDELTDLARFEIRRNIVERDKTPQFETIAEIDLSSAGSKVAQYQYLDRQITPGKRYEYNIVSVNQEGNRGAPTNVLRVTFVGAGSLVESF